MHATSMAEKTSQCHPIGVTLLYKTSVPNREIPNRPRAVYCYRKSCHHKDPSSWPLLSGQSVELSLLVAQVTPREGLWRPLGMVVLGWP
jgi:hypothetical protein